MMKKYFSSGFFLNLKSVLSAFQRTQPERVGAEQETVPENKAVIHCFIYHRWIFTQKKPISPDGQEFCRAEVFFECRKC